MIPRNKLINWALVGLATLALPMAAGIAYGWLASDRVRPADFADALETHAGAQAGFRRAHAKGICISGEFESTGSGSELSRASLFAQGTYRVSGRFSTGGSNPWSSDGRVTFHSLALRIYLPGGEEFRTAMNHVPLFVINDPADFPALQAAQARDPLTGLPDQERISAFFAEHPESATFRQWMSTHDLPSSFGNATYFSANTFGFLDDAGRESFVKWKFVPNLPLETLDRDTLGELPEDFLFTDLENRLHEGPLIWTMVVTLAEPDDVTNDPTVLWPEEREEFNLGRLIIRTFEAEAGGECQFVNFDPLILPDGIVPSEDPILFARSAAYSTSVYRRSGEDQAEEAMQ